MAQQVTLAAKPDLSSISETYMVKKESILANFPLTKHELTHTQAK